MELVRDYDPHAALQQRVNMLSKQLIELEARVWQLKDAFYAHTHPVADDTDEDDWNPREEDEDR